MVGSGLDLSDIADGEGLVERGVKGGSRGVGLLSGRVLSVGDFTGGFLSLLLLASGEISL